MRLIIALMLLSPFVFAAEPEFPLTEDSKPQPNVPKGTMVKETYTAKEGSVFPGTQREYQIYLPAGHDSSKPAAFMVFQDGVIYQAPVVFDNLIAKKDIPPLVGIFIKPGVVPAANDNALPRFNRSYEYDSITPTYSQFLIDEFLPAIEAKNGLKLSTDPNHAAISGNSSGGICAFMVAWHRPDRFRRVFTGVGTYVGIHGADQLPVLVRKFEPKPLRVFLQSGTGDNNLYCGDWWMANQMMERSLAWAGYDVNHAWGEGGHNAKHASQIFPDVLRWLWRDWQTNIEVKANPKGESKWKGYEVVGDGDWESCWQTPLRENVRYLSDAEHVVPSLDGTVWSPLSLVEYFNQQREKRVRHDAHSLWHSGGVVACSDRLPGGLVRVPAAGPAVVAKVLKNEEAFFSGCSLKDGTLIFSQRGGGETSSIHIFSAAGEWLRKADSPFEDEFCQCASHSGFLFVTEESSNSVRVYRQTDFKPIDDENSGAFLPGLSRITLSPDQSMLLATSSQSHCVYSGRIGITGLLEHWQPHVELQADADDLVDARGLCVDTNGWLYVATSLGIQVCDQAGRVNFIIPTPKQPYDVCFGQRPQRIVYRLRNYDLQTPDQGQRRRQRPAGTDQTTTTQALMERLRPAGRFPCLAENRSSICVSRFDRHRPKNALERSSAGR